MADIDLRLLRGDAVVVYFGGSAASIDAYTFANALIALADTARSVNAVLYPGEDIEILLEATEPGSFRALLRKIQKGAPGFFSRGAETLFWSAVALVLLEPLLGQNPQVKITVNTDEVIVDSGSQHIIVPRSVHEALPNLRKSPEVQANVSRAFRVMHNDSGVKAFGLALPTSRSSIESPPIFTIPSENFEKITETIALPPEHLEKTRPREEKARLVILKAWLNHAKRKWSFEWNGIPISAPIKDEKFLNQLSNRDYLIGAGDALDVVLTFKQNYIDELGVYENDHNSFVIKEVIKPVPRTVQPKLGLAIRPIRRPRRILPS